MTGEDDRPRLPAHEPTLAQEPEEGHGRIGYGALSRWTPIGIAALIVLALVAIWLAGRGDDRPAAPAGLVGSPAPEVAFTTFDGETMLLSDLRGKVVVVNFWASWCEPCRREAVVFDAVYAAEGAANVPVVILGVDIANDSEAAARDFADQNGITYPLTRDAAISGASRGPIELAFGLGAYYPSTIVIGPDGVITGVQIGEIDAAGLNALIATARGVS